MVGIISLRAFDPILQYPATPGMPIMTSEKRESQRDLMLALLSEMLCWEANPLEVARAVRHSMVVMNAEKHKLNYVESALDNDIAGLTKKYLNTTQEVLNSIVT